MVMKRKRLMGRALGSGYMLVSRCPGAGRPADLSRTQCLLLPALRTVGTPTNLGWSGVWKSSWGNAKNAVERAKRTNPADSADPARQAGFSAPIATHSTTSEPCEPLPQCAGSHGMHWASAQQRYQTSPHMSQYCPSAALRGFSAEEGS